jgi:hypothetical protein
MNVANILQDLRWTLARRVSIDEVREIVKAHPVLKDPEAIWVVDLSIRKLDERGETEMSEDWRIFREHLLRIQSES